MARSAPPTLPDELILDEILKRLPVKLVVRFRTVSKLWNFLLSQPNYIRCLLNLSISQNLNDDYLLFSTRKYDGNIRVTGGISILSQTNSSEICLDNVPYPVCNRPDIVQLVGSINGLVCIVFFSKIDSGFDSYHFILWNPAMNLSKKILIPDDCPAKIKSGNRFMFGFGFDSMSNNYNIIAQSTDSEQAVVYSCETDSWINIVGSRFSQHIHRGRMFWIPSVIVKGVCYWYSFRTSDQVLKFETRNNELTYFTVPRFGKCYTLVNLNDCLARIEYASVGEDIMDVYFFNEECCIWNKIYTTNIGIYDLKSIQSCFRNGEMIVFDFEHRKYSFCDPKSKVTKGLACLYDKKYFYYFGKGFSYTPSLVAREGLKSLQSIMS